MFTKRLGLFTNCEPNWNIDNLRSSRRENSSNSVINISVDQVLQDALNLRETEIPIS